MGVLLVMRVKRIVLTRPVSTASLAWHGRAACEALTRIDPAVLRRVAIIPCLDGGRTAGHGAAPCKDRAWWRRAAPLQRVRGLGLVVIVIAAPDVLRDGRRARMRAAHLIWIKGRGPEIGSNLTSSLLYLRAAAICRSPFFLSVGVANCLCAKDFFSGMRRALAGRQQTGRSAAHKLRDRLRR